MIYNPALVNELTDNAETALYDVVLEHSMNPGLKQACRCYIESLNVHTVVFESASLCNKL